tara:strand:+ start:279 stop:419 length:141 start_codon:yes stop_codon:yes gene_type:complete
VVVEEELIRQTLQMQKQLVIMVDPVVVLQITPRLVVVPLLVVLLIE